MISDKSIAAPCLHRDGKAPVGKDGGGWEGESAYMKTRVHMSAMFVVLRCNAKVIVPHFKSQHYAKYQ